jgi:beta-phosphoglucomutase-like phosphatase (HAD superfamily)
MSEPAYAVVIFDFDGVIVESPEIKDRAFREVFAAWPAHQDAIMAYHLAHNTTSRYIKFEYILREILRVEPTPAALADVAERFNDYTFRGISTCPEVPGAEACLRELYGRVPLYLASATPTADLRRITDARKLTRYFADLYGAPQPKPEMFAAIQARERVAKAAMVFIGDSLSDLAAARAFGMDFLGRQRTEPFPADAGPCFPDLHGLAAYLRTHLRSAIP